MRLLVSRQHGDEEVAGNLHEYSHDFFQQWNYITLLRRQMSKKRLNVALSLKYRGKLTELLFFF